MKQLTKWAMLAALTMSLASCGGRRTVSDDDLNLDGEAAPADSSDVVADSNAPAKSGGDDFSDFDDDKPAKASEPSQDQGQAAAAGDDLKLDDDPAANAETPPPADAQAAEAPPADIPPAEPIAEAPAPEPTPVPDVAATPVPAEPEPAPPAPAEPAPPMSMPTSDSNATITSIKYRANDNGGTVVIEANGPIQYTTRSNPELKQLVVEVPNTILPKKLQRPLNTRDIQGSIGAIDPYQHSGSNVSRFVIQLREGAQDPVVQQEGNAILVVANAPAPKEEAPVDLTSRAAETPVNSDMSDQNMLASQSLSEFLAGNTKFYGKRISIEVDNIDVRQALRFLTEESGVNMVVADEVKGNISLKLRQVPWDQALVMIMKARRLGYTRQGNVLRIATQEQLKQEEDDATKLAQAKRTVEPLKVRMFPVSYAQVADLEKRVTSFLSERGKVVGDIRTNSLVVTDIAENMERIAKLVQSLDIQPPQVLIEGKIVEAQEDFNRAIGITWGFDGADLRIGRTKAGPVNLHPQLTISPVRAVGGAANMGLTLGTLDGFGNLTAALALNERENKVKVISSPRIVTLTNEQATITQTTEIPLRQITISGNNAQTTFTFKPLTLRLEVTPQITADSSIIMKVNLKREFAGASQDQQSEAVPVNSREANTKVLVRNGQTAVIGGIYQSDVTEAEQGVPYLREIPFVGALFRGRQMTKQKNELLLFLTPRVMAQGDSGAAAAPNAPPPPGDL